MPADGIKALWQSSDPLSGSCSKAFRRVTNRFCQLHQTPPSQPRFPCTEFTIPISYTTVKLHLRLPFAANAALAELSPRSGRSDPPTTPSHAIAWSRFTAFSS